MPAHDAILFDLDGVLVDSRHAFARSLNAALAANGLAQRPEHELYRYIGPPLHTTLADLGAGDRAQACVDAYRERYLTHSASETEVVAGIGPVLAALGEQVPMVVATSKTQALAEPLLAALGLRQYFSAVVGPDLAAENESKATTVGRALTHLPADARPVMVGDRKYDIAGAAAHGLKCIGVLWGIGSEAELTEAGAARLASAPADLLTLVDI